MIHHHRRSKTQSIKKLAALNISSLKKPQNYHLTGKWPGALIGTWKLLDLLKSRQMMKILLFLISKDNWRIMHCRRSINSDLNLEKTGLKQIVLSLHWASSDLKWVQRKYRDSVGCLSLSGTTRKVLNLKIGLRVVLIPRHRRRA